uniref:Mononegavirus-type SAM-dependent 2'-O-MTase domain-containing protein n=1 Tax=Trichuris muris TaxID=70415 RepID=A0A5S6Q6K3_TRIMR
MDKWIAYVKGLLTTVDGLWTEEIRRGHVIIVHGDRPSCAPFQELCVPASFDQHISVDAVVDSLFESSLETTRSNISSRVDHMYRLDGVSTAHYKFRQIMSHYNIVGESAVCLGEGEGSLAAMLYKEYVFSLIFYNSLIKCTDFVPQRYTHYRPTELVLVPDNVLYEYNLSLYGENDLSTTSF